METLIPAPADYKVRSVMKFLNAQSIAPMAICRQLCQVYGHTRLDGQHISCRSSAERCLIIIPIPITRNSLPVFPPFLQEVPVRSAKMFSEWQRGEDECHTVVPIPGGRLLRHRDTNVGSTVWQMSQFRRWICWKIPQCLLYLFQ